MLTALDTLSGNLSKELVTINSKRREMGETLSIEEVNELTSGKPEESPQEKFQRATKGRNMESLAAFLSWDIAQGCSLSAAMSRHPKSFSVQQRHAVHAGEESGEISRVLFTIADQQEESRQRILALKKALTYPLVVAVLASFSMCFLPGLFFGDLANDGVLQPGLGLSLIHI